MVDFGILGPNLIFGQQHRRAIHSQRRQTNSTKCLQYVHDLHDSEICWGIADNTARLHEPCPKNRERPRSGAILLLSVITPPSPDTSLHV